MTRRSERIISFSIDKEKKILFLILAFSFLIKLILALCIQSPIRSDSYDYQTLGMGLLSGEYSLDGRPTAYVGPGYPLFLSGIYFLFGEGQFYVKLIQSVLETGTCYFFYKVSRNFFDIPNSFLSLILFTFFPSNIIFSQAILSESLFGFFSILFLFLLLKEDLSERKFLIFIAGIIFGYSVLIRTAFMTAIILIPLYFIFNRKILFGERWMSKSVLCIFFFITGFVIVISPWSIRNKIEIGTFSPGTTAGVNFWAGSNPNSTGTYYNELASSLPLDYHNEAERDAEYFKLGLKYALENPEKYIILGIKKLGYLFSSERMAIIYFYEPQPGETSTQVYKKSNLFLFVIVNLFYFTIMLSGTWGLLLLKKDRFYIYGFILCWVITIFLFVGLARYHYVLIPFFVIGAVNLITERKNIFSKLTLPKKLAGYGFCIFLISIWCTELYLLIKSN